ncbi:MAG TPA: hypothetical protein EYG78_00140 [Sulfurovum sp.]|nr:hypothetical protein [Sulfurovum sp.]
MTKKFLYGIFLIIGIVLIGVYIYQEQTKVDRLINDQVAVVVVYEKGKKESIGVRAFLSVLEEEGVPYLTISNGKLIAADPEDVLKSKPAIIYPDSAAAVLSTDTAGWIASYIKAGGSVQLASDAGSRNRENKYWLEGALFDKLAGIKRVVENKKSRDVFLYGPVTFSSREDADYFGIPRGKCDENNNITGYRYGTLTYTYTYMYTVETEESRIYATGKGPKKKVPLLLSRHIGKGELLFVNLPLASLKGNGDDLLLRSVLRTFLFKMVKVPHIVSSPDAKGGLVLNLHIDSNAEHPSLPWFITHGYITSKLKYSMHITAGPDCDVPGDNDGFDAKGKGRKIVEDLMRFGIIGSHGGWLHNWFADQIQKGKLDKEGIKKYIEINNRALEEITGYPIKEYSAPNGVFPQPESVEILASLGMESYYYTGDIGSSPNRTFYQNKMLSRNIIAFPVTVHGNKASLYEFEKEKVPDKDVADMLRELVDYTVKNRVVRLFYTHPYDIYLGPYKNAAKQFIDYCIAKQEHGELNVETMSYFRDFLLRLIDTQKMIRWHDGVLDIALSSKGGLKSMVIAVPKQYLNRTLKLPATVKKDELYYYVPTETNTTDYHMVFRYE